jgi:hypothetical protein
MIKIDLSVREALNLVSNGCNLDMYEKIVCALEMALGVNQRRMVTITGGMSTNNRIHCIKAIRLHTGWGLKEAKDWTDVIVGHYDQFGKWRDSGTNRNTMTLKTPEAAEALLRDLTTLGCEGYLS